MKSELSSFCEMYGNTLRNRILEQLLENQDLDFAVGDLARETKISRPKAYELMRNFEGKGFVKKSRIVGKTQLYILDKENPIVRLLIQSFKACLRLTVEKYTGNDRKIRQPGRAAAKEGIAF